MHTDVIGLLIEAIQKMSSVRIFRSSARSVLPTALRWRIRSLVAMSVTTPATSPLSTNSCIRGATAAKRSAGCARSSPAVTAMPNSGASAETATILLCNLTQPPAGRRKRLPHPNCKSFGGNVGQALSPVNPAVRPNAPYRYLYSFTL